MSLPASDASILAHLAEFPEFESEDDKRELLDALSPEARDIAEVLLGDDSKATPQIREKVEWLKRWAISNSSLR